MIRRAIPCLLVLGLLMGLSAPRADAWGDRAKRSITVMALQVLKQNYPYSFQSEEGSNYDNDVVAGSTAGLEALSDNFSVATDAETVQSIATEIELLRDVRQFGPGSFFAYRMGALGAVVADLMLPFGLARTADEQRLHDIIVEDIDQHLTRIFSADLPSSSSVDAEVRLQLEMRPVVERIAQRLRNRLGPRLEFLARRRVARDKIAPSRRSSASRATCSDRRPARAPRDRRTGDSSRSDPAEGGSGSRRSARRFA